MIISIYILLISSKSHNISYIMRIYMRIWGLRMFLLYKIEFFMIRIIFSMILLKWKLGMNSIILNFFFDWFFFKIIFIKSFILNFYNIILIKIIWFNQENKFIIKLLRIILYILLILNRDKKIILLIKLISKVII